MTWRELWRTTLTNLRALLGGRADTPAAPPSLPDKSMPDTNVQPVFPTVWEDPRAATASPTPPDDVEPGDAEPKDAEPEDIEPEDAEQTSAAVAPDPESADTAAVQPDLTEAKQPSAPDTAPDSPAASSDDSPNLSVVLESVLFVASEPVTPAQLARSLNVSEAEIQAELVTLAEHYRTSGRGLRLQLLNDKVQLVTAPAVATYVEAFLNLDATTRLSGPALETLAVVAYRQPVTRAQVEAIRGVDCASVLRSLVQRGLIAEVGRGESVGRPILYGVTEMFMQHFGLEDLKDLPPLEENEADRLWAASLLAEPDAQSTDESGDEADADPSPPPDTPPA